MKAILSPIVFGALVTVSSLSHGAEARSMQVHGDKARDLMEALAGAGYKMHSGDSFADQPITVKARAITCKYTVAQFPDEWMSDAMCIQGNRFSNRPVLKNSLSLMKALASVIEADPALGSRYIQASGISCVLSYEAKAYSCELISNMKINF